MLVADSPLGRVIRCDRRAILIARLRFMSFCPQYPPKAWDGMDVVFRIWFESQFASGGGMGAPLRASAAGHVHLDERPSGGTPHLNFVNEVLGEEELKVPVRYGVLLSALMDALYESAEKQRPVKVEPVPAEL